MSSQISYQFEVRVSTQFLEEQSNKEQGPYIFAYTIEIENIGQETAQLLSRHWIITDAHHIVQEIKGDGVVGEQPTLRPGERFEYTSACPLPTPVGTMKGSYTFISENGEQFAVEVPEFLLSMPRVLH
jgi:ApaG protein